MRGAQRNVNEKWRTPILRKFPNEHVSSVRSLAGAVTIKLRRPPNINKYHLKHNRRIITIAYRHRSYLSKQV